MLRAGAGAREELEAGDAREGGRGGHGGRQAVELSNARARKELDTGGAAAETVGTSAGKAQVDGVGRRLARSCRAQAGSCAPDAEGAENATAGKEKRDLQ